MDAALSQEVLLDHFKSPRRRGAVPDPAFRREGVNPACGDRVAVTAAARDGRLELMAEGAGCVVSQASASMMAQALQGLTADEARACARAVADWLAGRGPAPDLSRNGMEDLECLAGVRRHPARAKCAGLAWGLLLEGIGCL